MNRPRSSLARLMVMVLVAAIDCGLIRLFLATGEGLLGLGAIGFAVSLALAGMILFPRWFRRFATGFLATTFLLTASAVTAFLVGPSRQVHHAFWLYTINAVWWLPRSISEPKLWEVVGPSDARLPGLSFAGAVYFELAISVPILMIALAGGVLAVLLRKREHPRTASDLTPS